MKILLFTDPLPELVLSGKKTVTRRVEDQRGIKEGDKLSLGYNDGREFVQAIATKVKETTFGELTEEDFIGHEKFTSDEEMYKRYSGYYHKDITPQTQLKIITFKLIERGAIKYNADDIVDHDAVFAVIKDDEGRVLLEEHLKYNFRTLPGGKVKQGQSLLEGLQEEIAEECNVQTVEAKKIIDREFIYDRDNRKVKVHEHIFDVTNYTGEINNNEPHKHRELRFRSIDDIKEMPFLSDVTILYLETLGIIREANLVNPLTR